MTDTFICDVGDWLCYKSADCSEHLGIVTFNTEKQSMEFIIIDGNIISSNIDSSCFLKVHKQNLTYMEFEAIYKLENELIKKGNLHFHRTKKMFDKHRDEFGTLFSLSRDFEKRNLVDLDMIFATLIENYVIETKAYINKINELHSSLNSN